MGKQYNKLIKRRRRTAYLARRKAALSQEKPKSKRPAKTAPSRTTRKHAAKKAPAKVEEQEELAEKAKAEIVKSIAAYNES